MSFIYRDATLVPRATLNMYIATWNKFNKAWGTRFVNGVEVYEDKLVYYQNGGFIEDAVLKSFVKSMGLEWEEFTSQEVDNEIEQMWFILKDGFVWSGELPYTNFGKEQVSSVGLVSPTAQELSDKFNSQMIIEKLEPTGEIINEEIEYETVYEYATVDVTVAYGGELKRYIKEHSLPYTTPASGVVAGAFNSSEIRSILDSDPWYYYVNSRHLPHEENTAPFQSIDGYVGVGIPRTTYKAAPLESAVTDVSANYELGMFALLGDSSVFEFKEIVSERVIPANTSDGLATRYEYIYRFTYKGCTSSSKMIGEMIGWYNYYNTTKTIIDTKPKKVMINNMINPSIPTNAPKGITYTLDGVYMHRTSVSTYEDVADRTDTFIVKNELAKMKKKEFIEFLSESVDTDYSVEDAEWWEQILAIVIVIIAFIISYFTQQWYLLKGATEVFALAAAIGVGSLAMTIGSAILSAVGGLSAQGLVSIIGAFAQITGLVSTVLGIYTIIQNAIKVATRSVAEKAIDEGIKQSLREVAIQEAMKEIAITDVVKEIVTSAITDAVSSVTNIFTNLANMTSNQVASLANSVIKIAGKGLEYYNDQLEDDVNDAQNEVERLQEEYDELTSDVSIFQGAALYAIINEKLSSPDLLQDMAIKIDSTIGRDKSFSRWDSNVNA